MGSNFKLNFQKWFAENQEIDNLIENIKDINKINMINQGFSAILFADIYSNIYSDF